MISNTPSIFQTLPLRSQTPDLEGREFGASEGVFDKFKGCLSQTPQGFPKGVWKPQRECLENLGVFDSNTPSIFQTLPLRSQTPDPEGREIWDHRGSV